MGRLEATFRRLNMSVNKVILLGRLGQDPEMKFTPSGQGVCNFSIATSKKWTDKAGQKQERTEWHRIVVWGKLAELCNQYLSKGRQAFVEGELQTRSWEDDQGGKRYATEINAMSVQFIGGQQEAGQQQQQQSQQQQPQQQQQQGQPQQGQQPQYTADDIPF